jgi:hypothetical protein
MSAVHLVVFGKLCNSLDTFFNASGYPYGYVQDILLNKILHNVPYLPEE